MKKGLHLSLPNLQTLCFTDMRIQYKVIIVLMYFGILVNISSDITPFLRLTNLFYTYSNVHIIPT